MMLRLARHSSALFSSRRALSALLSLRFASHHNLSPSLPPPVPSAVPEWRGIHSCGGGLGFKSSEAVGAQYAVDDLAADQEKKGGGDEDLDVAKLGSSSVIVNNLPKKGISKLFPIQGYKHKKLRDNDNNATCGTSDSSYPMVMGGRMFHEWCKSVAADTLRMAVKEAEDKIKSKAGVIGKSDGNELGMKLDSGYLSTQFITDSKSQKCELLKPLILIHEKKLYNSGVVDKLIEFASKKRRSLLVVAEDVDSDALGSLILSKLSSGVKVCAIRAPGLGDKRRESLQNLANITGVDVITKELGVDIDTVGQDMLGSCKKAIISKNDTIILEGAGAQKPTEEKSAEEKDIELVKMHSSESEFLLKHLLEEEKKLERRQRERLTIKFKNFIKEHQSKRRRATQRR